MKHHDLAALASAQHGAFSRRQATEVGFNRYTVRRLVQSGQWQQHSGNVFTMVGSPATWHQRIWCALLEAGPAAVLSHRTAAQLLGIPGFSKDVVELTKRETLHHELALARLHRTSWLPPEHITERDGLRLTSVA